MSRNRGEQIRNWSGIAKRLAYLCIEIAIAGSKDEAASELKRVLSQPVLAMTARASAFTGCGVIVVEAVKQLPNVAARYAWRSSSMSSGNVIPVSCRNNLA